MAVVPFARGSTNPWGVNFSSFGAGAASVVPGVVRSTVVGAVLRGGWTSPRLDDASLHATSSEASPTPVAIITTERFIGLF